MALYASLIPMTESDPTRNDAPDMQPGAIQLAPGAWIMPDRLRLSYARSSGPGGQSVNKVNTKAELRVSVMDIQGLHDTAAARLRRLAGSRLTQDDELVIQADTSRSQRQNRMECEDRLRELLLRALTPPKPRKKTKPSKAAKERRLKAKREQSEKKSRRRGED